MTGASSFPGRSASTGQKHDQGHSPGLTVRIHWNVTNPKTCPGRGKMLETSVRIRLEEAHHEGDSLVAIARAYLEYAARLQREQASIV